MKRMPAVVRAVFSVLFICLTALPALAAGLSGTVRDSSGGAAAAVEVVVMTPQRTVVATTHTRRRAVPEIASLPVGRYLLVARAVRFRETTIAADVAATEGAPLAITLDIDQVRQDVSVTATPGTVVDRQFAVQPVNIITQEETAQRATTVLAQAVTEEVGVSLQRTTATSPTCTRATPPLICRRTSRAARRRRTCGSVRYTKPGSRCWVQPYMRDRRRPAEPVVARSRRPAHRLGSQPHEHSQLLHQWRDGSEHGRARPRSFGALSTELLIKDRA